MKKFIVALFLMPGLAWAGEGMWLPLLLKGFNEQQMQAAGCSLSAEQIFSINSGSLKDCIVQLDGCTSGVISSKGLLITNHHCAFSGIQAVSTLEKNYLENGFWSRQGYRTEIPLPNATASFFVRMEDVTSRVLKDLPDTGYGEARKSELEKRMRAIEKEASEQGKFRATVRDFFSGTAYYLFVARVYKDIRLVGAPPSSIGKFGGETDNWMWPRHTGDFALLRVYADSLGNPAPYNEKNKPLSTPKFLPFSLGGVKENDFSMIMGFPGRTNRYASSDQLKMMMENEYPAKIKLNGKILDIWKEAMDKDPAIKIKYAAKYARRSNGWKNSKGQSLGLQVSGAIALKELDEKNLTSWIFSDENRKNSYGMVFTELQKAVREYNRVTFLNQYYQLAGKSSELVDLSAGLLPLYEALKKTASASVMDSLKKAALKKKEDFYKNFDAALDKQTFGKLLLMYMSDVPAAELPAPLAALASLPEKERAEACNSFVEKLYRKSSLVTSEGYASLIEKASEKSLNKEPFFDLSRQMTEYYNSKLKPFVTLYGLKTDYYRGRLIQAMKESQPNKAFYPDANSTMRLSYGKVTPYEPKDAVHYHWQTFADGIVEKALTREEDYRLPPGFLQLLSGGDFGRYAQNGKLPVAFLTDNDITGGNSGSPVLNGKGHIIGLAFDGNWEGITGDLVFEPSKKRTICCDIRYVCYIIEKYAGAQNIMSELLLVP
jgi:hypothetical protein